MDSRHSGAPFIICPTTFPEGLSYNLNPFSGTYMQYPSNSSEQDRLSPGSATRRLGGVERWLSLIPHDIGIIEYLSFDINVNFHFWLGL